MSECLRRSSRILVLSPRVLANSCHHDRSVVHELRVPPQLQLPSSGGHRSKGLATDPCQTVALLPFVDRATEARLGVWSLDSGEFVGSKAVVNRTSERLLDNSNTSSASASNNDGGDCCLELCPKITRAWTRSPEDERGGGAPTMVPGSFGLWLNWGSRGIHHIVCDGRVDVDC